MSKEYGYLIDNKWHESSKKAEVRSPYNGEVAAVINVPDEKNCKKALDSAHNAYNKFRNASSHQKKTILRKISEGIEKRKDEIARVLVLEGGKPLKSAKVEVDRAIKTFSVGAEEADRLSEGELIPVDIAKGNDQMFGISKRFPLGIVMGISPFNFPLNLVAHKVAPSVASGNSIVLKPAMQTPLSALILGEIAIESDIPPGIFNIIPIPGSNTENILEDTRIKKISFTGSDTIGWHLMEEFSRKRVTLELGGNAATVIDEDPPDFDFAVKRNVWGAFYQAGQSCISVQRIFVHESIYEEYVDAFVKNTEELKTGDPLNEETDIGPVIDTPAADRIMGWIDEAVNDGAKMLTGGNRDGNVIEPVVLTETKPAQKVNCDEVFGPVVSIERYNDYDKVLEQVNNSRYGLQAAVFTKDIKKAFKAYDILEVGGVIVNDFPSFRVENMPYGGSKDSGIGREGLRYAIEEMTELKLMVVNLNY